MRKLIYAISLWVWAISPVSLFGQPPSSTESQPVQTPSTFSAQQKGAILSFHVANDNMHIVADVYSLSGRHVARILDRVVSQGNYSFNPFATCKDAVSRQTYIISLSNGIETESIRMLNLNNESVSNLQSIRTSSAGLAKIESANASNKVITGVVTDASNNSPLNQVKVSLDSVNYVFTGVDGKFTIGAGNLVSSPTHPSYLIFENSGYVPAARYINPDSQQTSVQLHQIAINNANRPASANGDTVITPFGKCLRSQCFKIEHGHFLDNQGGQMREIDASGHVLRNFAPVLGIHPPLDTSEWITYGYWDNKYYHSGSTPDTALQQFSAGWTVPSVPSKNDTQLIYLFNALQQMQNGSGVAILQPVLQWGYGPDSLSGFYWVLASWYACSWGYFYSSPVNISPTDALVGVITAEVNNYPGIFTYDCEFQNIWATDLVQMNIPELTECDVTLEAYSDVTGLCPTYCTNYPASSYTIFGGLSVLTGFSNPQYRSLTWHPASAQSPPCKTKCNFGTSVLSNANPNGRVALLY